MTLNQAQASVGKRVAMWTEESPGRFVIEDTGIIVEVKGETVHVLFDGRHFSEPCDPCWLHEIRLKESV